MKNKILENSERNGRLDQGGLTKDIAMQIKTEGQKSK